MNPEEAIPDAFGHVSAVRFREQIHEHGKWRDGDAVVTMPARSVFVAAGTTPNVTYEREYQGTFQMDERRRFFKPHVAERGEDGSITLVPAPEGFFTSYSRDGRYVTYYGDNHPESAGNVVKAMASAAIEYPQRRFPRRLGSAAGGEAASRRGMPVGFTASDDDFLARVERVVRLTPTIVELIVRAPAAARHFQPGQFYRLQNFETTAPVLGAGENGPRMLMEGLALTGAWVDKAQGLLWMIALEMGVSSRQCAYLRPGEPVLVMGPTGAPTEISARRERPARRRRIGQRRAVLDCEGPARQRQQGPLLRRVQERRRPLQARGSRGRHRPGHLDHRHRRGDPRRPQDAHFRGNIVQAMIAYAKGELGEVLVPLKTVDRIIAIGSDRMMSAIKLARLTTLDPFFKEDHVAIASINSPMQCMMKEVCAQCLQRHVDPKTGKETVIFTCFNQDQHMDQVDFPNLSARLRQNTVKEKLASLWFEKLMAEKPLPSV